MAVSWSCAEEQAIESRPSDFGSGESAYLALGTDLQDVSGSWATLQGSGLENFEGKFSLGLKLLAEIIGGRATEMSGLAGDVESAYLVCETELDTLTATSDALLTESEELLTERDSAVRSYAVHDGLATFRRNKRNEYEHGTDEREHWHGKYVEMKGYRDAFARTRDAKADSLETNQVEFDRLRDDEEAAHVLFADTLGGLDVAKSAVEVDVSSAEARSVELLITYLDAQFLAVGTGAGSGRNRAALRAAIRSARETIAGLAGVDTEELDRLVEIVEAKRELEELGTDELTRRIHEALREGNLAEAQRLAELISLATLGMTPDEARDYLSELGEVLVTQGSGYLHLITLFATADGEIPAWMLEILLPLDVAYGDFFLDDATKAMLADVLGLDPDDAGFNDAVLLQLYRKLKDQGGSEFLDAVVNGDYGSPLASQVAFEFLVENPAELRELVNGNSTAFQDVLEVLGDADLSADNWSAFVDAYVSEYPLADDLSNPELTAEQAWGNFGERIGNLQAQIAEIGGDEYDPGSLAVFVLKQGIGVLPGGSAINAGLSGLQALAGGYTPDTTYERLGSEAAADLNRQLIIMGQMTHLDPKFAETVDAELIAARHDLVDDPSRTGPPTQDEIVERMMQTDSAAAVQIKHWSRVIEGSRADGTDGI